MKKRITAIIMALVMVMALLPTTVFAANPIEFKATANKTTAELGDTISYTVTMSGAVTDLVALNIELDIPAGLTFVAGSGRVVPGAKETLKGTSVEFTETAAGKIFMADAAYTGTAVVTLFTFECTVNAEAKGALTVALNIDENSIFNSTYDNIPFTKTSATVNVPVRATGIKLNKTALSLSLNGTKEETLLATVEPSDATDTVTWTSSNTKVATVVNGKVTAVGAGTAVITVRAGNQTATCTVNVSACDHVFTAETVKAEALKTAGDCLNKAVYYKSCAKCGAVSSNDSDTFMGAFGSHKMTKHEATVATCVKEGNPEYWNCSVCKKNYDSATGGTEVTNIVIQRDPANHVGSYKYEVNKTDATKHDKICTGCNTVVETVAHSGGTATCTKLAECAKCGAEYGKLAEHQYDTKWTSDGTGHWHVCTVCNKATTTLEKHNLTAATCQTPATCQTCGWNDGKTVACTPHSQNYHASDANKHWQVCQWCGKKINEDAHIWNTPAEGEAQFCKTCGYVKQAATTPCDKQHSNTKQAYDATYHYEICSTCGEKLHSAKHTFQETTVNGKKFRSCKECGYTEEIKTVTPTTPSGNNSNAKNPYTKNDGKKVQSGKTFDAGIALYVGLSVLSVTGGALVIGKKKEF